jgi:hypothetical protein
MPVINGTAYTKKELLRYASNLNQLAGITQQKLIDGKANGNRSYNFKTGGGLEYTVLPDKCLDIAAVTFNGVNISFLSKNGITSPLYTNPSTNDFTHYMTGGMLMTCGLLNAGVECEDVDGSFHPMHGRIGITPAEYSSAEAFWQGENYFLEAKGVMRESKLFGHNLTLSRKITSQLGENYIDIHDTLENNDPQDTEFMLLYHFNFGFPFLSDDLRLVFPDNKITPRTEQSQAGLNESGIISKPSDGFFEHVFFREITDNSKTVTVTVENPKLAIGTKLTYEKENLPLLVQWKSMRSGDYALGIEPSNSYIFGRKKERENGTLKVIKGFEKFEYKLRLEFYSL